MIGQNTNQIMQFSAMIIFCSLFFLLSTDLRKMTGKSPDSFNSSAFHRNESYHFDNGGEFFFCDILLYKAASISSLAISVVQAQSTKDHRISDRGASYKSVLLLPGADQQGPVENFKRLDFSVSIAAWLRIEAKWTK